MNIDNRTRTNAGSRGPEGRYRTFLAAAAVCGGLCGVGGLEWASPTLAAPAVPFPPPPVERDSSVRGDEITPRQQAAVARGLAYLATRQRADGNFSDGGGMEAASAITSLSALAFMSAGNLPDRGRYGPHVERGLQFVLNQAQQSGLLANEQSHGVMYAHGFATLFLAEVYGMTADERVRESLQRAVRLIHRSQNAEGGWRYQPVPNDADVSVTICQVMALRAARDAGIKVERDVIDRAVAYVRACQNADGGFSYQLGRGGTPATGGSSAFPRSAAGVATLYYAGVYEGEAIDNGLSYLLDFLPGRPRDADARERAGVGGGEDSAHYFYGQYYAAQTMFLAGGEHWGTWYPAIREELMTRQNADGSWSGHMGQSYSTAMALIVLQMPNRYLPVFSGKGPGS